VHVANRGRRWFGAVAAPLLLVAQGCESPTGIDRLEGAYSAEETAYFEEISLGSEYRSSAERIAKWAGTMVIRVHGAPGDADLRTVEQVIGEINDILGFQKVRLGSTDGNVDLWFAPSSEFPRLEPRYVAPNAGFVTVGWDSGGRIQRGRVLISSTGLTQRQRDHLIREEVTQALGLLRDSNRYPESIFYQGWSETTEYAEIDRVLIRMLYRDEIQAGMTRPVVRSVLSRLPRGGEML
jgi:hypothetical protein